MYKNMSMLVTSKRALLAHPQLLTATQNRSYLSRPPMRASPPARPAPPGTKQHQQKSSNQKSPSQASVQERHGRKNEDTPPNMRIDDEEDLNERAAQLGEDADLLRKKVTEKLPSARFGFLVPSEPTYESVLCDSEEMRGRSLENSRVFVKALKANPAQDGRSGEHGAGSRPIRHSPSRRRSPILRQSRSAQFQRKQTAGREWPSGLGTDRERVSLANSWIRGFGDGRAAQHLKKHKNVSEFCEKLRSFSRRVGFCQQASLLEKKRILALTKEMDLLWRTEWEIEQSAPKTVSVSLSQQILDLLQAKRLRKLSMKNLDGEIVAFDNKQPFF